MSGERSFLNLFRDSRTPLDSIRDKLVTLIYFVIVQCPCVRTTWYGVSCAGKGYTRAARDLRLMKGHAVTQKNTISAWNLLMVESGKDIFSLIFWKNGAVNEFYGAIDIYIIYIISSPVTVSLLGTVR